MLTEYFISAELRVATVITNLVLTWLLALGPLMVTELEEEHSHSYELLTEIVAAKFLLFLAAVAALTAQQFALLKLVQAAPALVAMAQAAVFLLALNPGVTVLAGLALYALLFLVSVALFRREARLS